MRKETYSEVNNYLTDLRKADIKYRKAYIFGSHAKGTAKGWSDIDLCIVSKEFGVNRHDERIRLLKLRNDGTLEIEPHKYNEKDLANRWDPLAVEIRKYGIQMD